MQAAGKGRWGAMIWVVGCLVIVGCARPPSPVTSRTDALARQWRRNALHRRSAASPPSSGDVAPQALPPARPSATRGKVNRGTCAVVRPDGALLTAYHVIAQAQTIRINLADGRSLPASVVRVDARHDLALLKVAARDLPYLPLASPTKDQLGEPVFTIGFPAVELLGREPRFTEGSISALSGPLGTPDLLQISVPLQPGNSGGPLINHAGELQGIISSIAAADRFQQATGALPQRINFAVKVRHVRGLYLPPPPPPPAAGRGEAIQRAQQAVCLVEARPAIT